MSYPHLSVLVNQILQSFAYTFIKVFVDGTLGAGGHAEYILNNHPEITHFIGFDQDPSALKIAEERLKPWKSKLQLIHSNFENFDSHLDLLGIAKIDGMMLDLGVSSMQLDQADKGFSFMNDGPLDMRMDPTCRLTAEIIVNEWSEQEIGRVLREYGEEKQWRSAAKAIVNARKEKPISTTGELAAVLRPVLAWKAKKGINPLTLSFQGLRICVNRELEVLEAVLPKAIDRLNSGGRLAVISFHSLEDRIVKNILRFAADDKYDTSGIGGVFLDKEPTVRLLTRKPLIADDEEIAKNPRSRSAKLRVIEKR